MILSWRRIWGTTFRHLIQFPTDFNKLSSTFYWPFMDILVFGYLSIGMSTCSPTIKTMALLSNIILWQVVNRANLCVSLDLLEEFWASNILNLFATPLKLGEWILATFLDGAIVNVFLIIFCIACTWAIFGFNLLVMGWWLIPLFLLSLMSGLAIGIFCTCFLLMSGSSVQSLAWMVSWGFSLFSGVFYPIEVLPAWLQVIAKVLPFHHTFDAVALLIERQGDTVIAVREIWERLFYSFATNCLFLGIVLLCFAAAFSYSKRKGLARLCD